MSWYNVQTMFDALKLGPASHRIRLIPDTHLAHVATAGTTTMMLLKAHPNLDLIDMVDYVSSYLVTQPGRLSAEQKTRVVEEIKRVITADDPSDWQYYCRLSHCLGGYSRLNNGERRDLVPEDLVGGPKKAQRALSVAYWIGGAERPWESITQSRVEAFLHEIGVSGGGSHELLEAACLWAVWTVKSGEWERTIQARATYNRYGYAAGASDSFQFPHRLLEPARRQAQAELMAPFTKKMVQWVRNRAKAAES